MVQTKLSNSKFPQKWHYAIQFSTFFQKTTRFKPSSLFLIFFPELHYVIQKSIFWKKQYGSNQIVSSKILSNTTLSWWLLNFLLKDNTVQTKQSIFIFPQKRYYAIQFSTFCQKTAWFKQSSVVLNFIKNGIMLFSTQFSF